MAAAGLLLTACLPDGSVERSSGVEASQSAARVYAGELADFALAAQGALLDDAGGSWRTGAIESGSLIAGGVFAYEGRASSSLDIAYCRGETAGGEANHMLVSWMNAPSGAGEFALKGLGRGAGAKVVQALARTLSPENVGLYENGAVRLAGRRASGAADARLVIPADCGIAIPAGAPVVVFEGMQAPEPDPAAVVSYEYETRSCADGGAGSLTLRREITRHGDGTASRGDWREFQNGCGGLSAQGREAARITDGTASAVNMAALAGAEGDIAASLRQLEEIECRRASAGGKDTGTGTGAQDGGGRQEGDNGQDGGLDVSTCDTQATLVQAYQGLDNPVLTGAEYQGGSITTACGTGSSRLFGASYQGYAGTADPGAGWQGTATYIRMVEDAHMNTGQAGEMISASQGRRGVWQGDTLTCTRQETMNIGCYTVLPQYAGPPQYTAVNLSGFDFTRTNRIDGWADPVSMTPGDPLPPDQGWTPVALGCEWTERQSFTNCPGGYTPSQAGEMERTITPADALGGVNESAWRSNQASECTRTETTTAACPAGETGEIVTTIDYTSTAALAGDTPSTTSTTQEQNNCRPVSYSYRGGGDAQDNRRDNRGDRTRNSGSSSRRGSAMDGRSPPTAGVGGNSGFGGTERTARDNNRDATRDQGGRDRGGRDRGL